MSEARRNALSAKVSDEMDKWVRDHCERTGISIQECLTRALTAYRKAVAATVR